MNIFRVFLYCIIGTLLEWYDFAVFGVLSTVLASIFFPQKDTTTSLLLTLSIFATGFIMRPLGGIFFGHIGDRYGRKKAIVWSMLLMATATTAIGLLPVKVAPHMIIVMALLSLRLLQGFSVGGDTAGVVAFISEISPPRHFFFFQSFFYAGASGGMLLGLIIGKSAITAYHGDVASNAWRVPFLMGALLGGIGAYLRVKAVESPLFVALQRRKNIASAPLKALLCQFPKELAILFVTFSAGSIIFYFTVIFYPVYLRQLGMNVSHVLTIHLTGLIVLLLLVPLFSLSVTYENYRKFIKFGLIIFIFLPVPLLWLVSHDPVRFALAGQILLVITYSTFEALINTMAVIAFPTAVRYTGVALCVNLTVLLGGTFPMVGVLLVKLTHVTYLPGFYVSLIAFFGFIAIVISQRMNTFRGF